MSTQPPPRPCLQHDQPSNTPRGIASWSFYTCILIASLLEKHDCTMGLRVPWSSRPSGTPDKIPANQSNHHPFVMGCSSRIESLRRPIEWGKFCVYSEPFPNQASHRPAIPREEYSALGRDAMTPEWTRKRTVHPTKSPMKAHDALKDVKSQVSTSRNRMG